MEEKVDLIYFGVAPWDVLPTPSASEPVREYSVGLSNSESRPGRLCVGTLEVDDSAPELRFVERNRRRNMVDKKEAI